MCFSSPCLFWPLGVTRSISACLRWVFGVEETFQRFFLTLTPMFSPHIKLLGGPQLFFSVWPPWGKMRSWRKSWKIFCFGFQQKKNTKPSPEPIGTMDIQSVFWRPQPCCFLFFRVFTHNAGDVACTHNGRMWKPRCDSVLPWWQMKWGVTAVTTARKAAKPDSEPVCLTKTSCFSTFIWLWLGSVGVVWCNEVLSLVSA